MDDLKFKLHAAQRRSQKFSGYSRVAIEETVEKFADNGKLPPQITAVLKLFQVEDARNAQEARTLYEQWCVSRAKGIS
jgi:hypothetical protein